MTAAAPTFTDAQLAEYLRLEGASDSVELKLTVPEGDHRAKAAALGLDPLEMELRQVFFFDTPDLALDDLGVVVRARRTQRKGDDSVVKLRPVVPDQLPAELRALPEVGVEVDAMPGGFVCSASYKHEMPKGGRVKRAITEGRPLRKLFSEGQQAFLAEHAPDGPGFDDLRVLGPLLVLKARLRPPGFDRKLVAEIWLFPDGSRVVELSTKAAPGEALQVAAEARVYLNERGFDLDGKQATKTRTALEYFAGTLE